MSANESETTYARTLHEGFTSTAWHVYTGAVTREIEGKPAYEGKPLNLIHLGIGLSALRLTDDIESNPIRQEKMNFRIWSHRELAKLTGNYSPYDDLSDNEKGALARRATRLSRVAIGDGFDITSHVASGDLFTLYLAQHTDSKSLPDLRLSTIEVPQDPQLAAVALMCARDALDYVTSSKFDRPQSASDPSGPGTMRHKFTVIKTPELPLNGYEPRVFLEDYQQTMLQELQRARRTLEHLQQGPTPLVMLVEHQEIVAQYEAAVGRVSRILEDD